MITISSGRSYTKKKAGGNPGFLFTSPAIALLEPKDQTERN
jgi:hypothetical protein